MGRVARQPDALGGRLARQPDAFGQAVSFTFLGSPRREMGSRNGQNKAGSSRRREERVGFSFLRQDFLYQVRLRE